MATRRSRSSIARPSSPPMDFIDLTEESPTTISSSSSSSMVRLQRRYRKLEKFVMVQAILGSVDPPIRTATTTNISENRNIARSGNRNVARSGNRTRRVIRSTIQTRSTITAANKSRDNSDNQCQNETINLDNTISPKHGSAYCVDDTTKLICAICLEEIQAQNKPTATCCGHVFCEECLNHALKKLKKCPRCRKSITKRSCIRLYF